MTQKLSILIQDSKRESVYDPPFDGQMIWIYCIFVGDINLKKKIAKPLYKFSGHNYCTIIHSVQICRLYNSDHICSFLASQF